MPSTIPHWAERGRLVTPYVLTNNSSKFPGCVILIYDADLQKVVDPESPPEPKPALPPLSERLPWCPECGGLLQTALSDCETCGWQFVSLAVSSQQSAVSSQQLTPHPSPLTPQIEALTQRRSQLMSQIDAIRRSGDVAPKGCSMEPYYVSKRLADGKKERFRYFRVKSEGQALFQNKHGQATKSLHLGTETSAAYKDWRNRLQRRNAIAALERMLDKAERKLQTLNAKR